MEKRKKAPGSQGIVRGFLGRKQVRTLNLRIMGQAIYVFPFYHHHWPFAYNQAFSRYIGQDYVLLKGSLVFLSWDVLGTKGGYLL